MLIRGDQLNERQRLGVLGAFMYRWTHENPWRERLYAKLGQPRIPLVSDAQWLREHAFHFTKDGARLMRTRRYAEPAARAGV